MATASTHTGICQACGRRQAVHVKTGRIAKHGYTVDWGFFKGTCQGSDHLPLEQDTKVNIEIVATLNRMADQADADAEAEITKVQVEAGRDWVNGKYVTQYKMVDRAEFEATQPRYHTFDNAVESVRHGLRRQAVLFRGHASELDWLRAEVHGTALLARLVEAPIKRETYSSYREAYARVEELKAAGHKAQQRREGWSQRYNVTYR